MDHREIYYFGLLQYIFPVIWRSFKQDKVQFHIETVWFLKHRSNYTHFWFTGACMYEQSYPSYRIYLFVLFLHTKLLSLHYLHRVYVIGLS